VSGPAGAPAGVRCGRLVRRLQADARIPAVQAALYRGDREPWGLQVGGVPGSRFRIGSVTKTFTAVLVLQCRDDGLLDLDAPLSAYLPGAGPHGGHTVARLLSHTAGIQREPHGDVWDGLDVPDAGRLLAELARAERVLPPGRRYHYSNLAFALLGEVVARLRGAAWAEVLADRVLAPLALADTGVDPGPAAATGYLVDAYSDHARPEPATDFAAIGPAAQLWSTAADMARWAAFLADPAALDPAGSVLPAATVDEMRWPRTVTDEAAWGEGFGLGVMLAPQRDRAVHVGHYGAMPGFLAAVFGRRGGPGTPPACGAALLGSSGAGAALLDAVHGLLAAAVEEDPADVQPWTPGPPAPPRYRSVLGRWWGEGFEYVFSWRGGALQARGADDPPGRPPAVFAPVDGDPDTLRTVSGRECGELLRLTRDPAGAVVRMHWATYRFTRRQETFDGQWATEG
jgi:CubicO group peptidase (beta-lactamase class C family)